MYCGSFKKNTVDKNSSIRRNKQIRLMLISSCAISGQKKSSFILKSRSKQII